MVYNLLHYEGLYVGASSALNMVGAVKTAEAVGKGNTVGEPARFLGTWRSTVPKGCHSSMLEDAGSHRSCGSNRL